MAGALEPVSNAGTSAALVHTVEGDGERFEQRPTFTAMLAGLYLRRRCFEVACGILHVVEQVKGRVVKTWGPLTTGPQL